LGLSFSALPKRFCQRRPNGEAALPRAAATRASTTEGLRRRRRLLSLRAHASSISCRARGSNAKSVNRSMGHREAQFAARGVLPAQLPDLQRYPAQELLKKVSEIPVSLDFDAFGRIYDISRQFARTGGAKGGEFYTPAPSCAHGEILEPLPRRILARLRLRRHVRPIRASSPSTRRTPVRAIDLRRGEDRRHGRLARMNLAVHGLEGDIPPRRPGQSTTTTPHKAWRLRLRLANPPFNVTPWQGPVKDASARAPLPSLAAPDNQLPLDPAFILLTKGRAPSSWPLRERRRASELQIRKQLIRSAPWTPWSLRTDMFYTVVLP